jgi:uncharacterized protein (DUF1015 family)
MPGTPAATPAASNAGRGLLVAPFRGVRFDPARVPDVAAVTSPPYDVIDPDSATHLEELDPHNVVRLILPRAEADDSPGRTRRYEHAAARLAAWQAEGYLRRDDTAAIYVYEQSREPGLLQRGLLATVELRHPDERVVLPHEDVMPGPVADRLELMRATQANLEPILLVYEGGGETVGVIDATAQGPALLETVTEDGILHRLWALTEPAALATVAADLQPRQALIADGHHRYATYRRLQAEQRGAGRGPGPWDRGLALLVDSGAYPLDLQAIHRVVEGLPLDEAVKSAAPVFTARDLGQDEEAARGGLRDATGHAFLLSDGASYTLLTDPDPAAVAAAMPPVHSATWRDLDASVLHALLLERLWQVPDGSPRVRYLHDRDGALRAARRAGGTAVLMRAVSVGAVMAVAATGERMPRQSTSFGPKPRTGLVLRLLDD